MAALADKSQRVSLNSTHKCESCGVSGKLSRCSGCNAVWYCSKEHQISDWKLRHKQQCKRLDKNINMQKAKKKEMNNKKNTKNSEYDFIFIGERGGMRGIEYTGTLGKLMFERSKKEAEETGDHQAIAMMYNMLRRFINPLSNSEFTETALKNQLNKMYSQNVDFSEYANVQFINTGGINPKLP